MANLSLSRPLHKIMIDPNHLRSGFVITHGERIEIRSPTSAESDRFSDQEAPGSPQDLSYFLTRSHCNQVSVFNSVMACNTILIN